MIERQNMAVYFKNYTKKRLQRGLRFFDRAEP